MSAPVCSVLNVQPISRTRGGQHRERMRPAAWAMGTRSYASHHTIMLRCAASSQSAALRARHQRKWCARCAAVVLSGRRHHAVPADLQQPDAGAGGLSRWQRLK